MTLKAHRRQVPSPAHPAAAAIASSSQQPNPAEGCLPSCLFFFLIRWGKREGASSFGSVVEQRTWGGEIRKDTPRTGARKKNRVTSLAAAPESVLGCHCPFAFSRSQHEGHGGGWVGLSPHPADCGQHAWGRSPSHRSAPTLGWDVVQHAVTAGPRSGFAPACPKHFICGAGTGCAMGSGPCLGHWEVISWDKLSQGQGRSACPCAITA